MNKELNQLNGANKMQLFFVVVVAAAAGVAVVVVVLVNVGYVR